jgi:hypothetical protein
MRCLRFSQGTDADSKLRGYAVYTNHQTERLMSEGLNVYTFLFRLYWLMPNILSVMHSDEQEDYHIH